MSTPRRTSIVTSAPPTFLQVPPPLLPSRALKVGAFFSVLSVRLVSAVTSIPSHETVVTARPYTVRCMKKLIAVLVLAGPLSAGYAADYAPQEFDFSELGTVESIRQVPILELLPDVFEHPVRPQTFDELLIRTDDGRTLVLRDEGLQRFVAGERVRLVSSSNGPRVEHQ